MNSTPQPAAPAPADINVSKAFDPARMAAFIAEICTLWERGRLLVDDGKTVSCTEAANAAIWKATLDLVVQSVSDTAVEIASPLFQAGFAAGDQSGYQRAMARLAKVPAIQNAAPLFDSQALVKSIGEELRKAYDAGLTAGKAPLPSRVASARQIVQRDREGGIASTVVHYQYEEAEGTNPPPL